MIGIAEIAHHLPPDRWANHDLREKFDIADGFLENKLGFTHLSRISDEETSDLCVRAFEALEAKTDLDRAQIDLCVVCTQTPDRNGIPHTSAIVQHKLGLPDTVFAYDISLGCSGYVYTLATVQALMQTHGFQNALLFTGDPYSLNIDHDDRDTAMLFGDGATVSLLRPTDQGGLWTPRKFLFGTDGNQQAINKDTGKIYMHGRAVFNFCAKKIPPHIHALLDACELTLDQVDDVLLHQGSKFIVDTIRKRLDLPAHKAPFEAGDYGNMASSSLPLILEPRLHDASLNRLVLSGFGVGLSWGTCLLERAPRAE